MTLRNPLCAMTAILLALLLAGCSKSRIENVYGRSRAPDGNSVNGTAVLAGMFRAAGHRVSTANRISPALSRFDVLVWAPDDFRVPSIHQRAALEQWLAVGNRTLIYIGRDYDAAPQYWQQIRSQLSSSEQWAAEGERGRAMARHDERVVAEPSRQFGRWFTLDREIGWHKVDALQSEHGWTDGVDVAATDIYVRTRLSPAQDEDTDYALTEPLLDLLGGELESWQYAVQKRPAAHSEVLLATPHGPLVTRVTDPGWLSSQILVVSNGAFLLNLPLVNREHRKLAGKVIAACGTNRRVGFVELPPGDRMAYFSEPETEGPSTLQALTIWPLGFILMHVLLLGMVLCFAAFPIFGRPRELSSAGASDFGRHIDALGRLLERTRDEHYAREQLRIYHRPAPTPHSPPNS